MDQDAVHGADLWGTISGRKTHVKQRIRANPRDEVSPTYLGDSQDPTGFQRSGWEVLGGEVWGVFVHSLWKAIGKTLGVLWVKWRCTLQGFDRSSNMTWPHVKRCFFFPIRNGWGSQKWGKALGDHCRTTRERTPVRRKDAPEVVRSHTSTQSEGRTRVISGQTENMIGASIKKTQLCTCRSDSARGEKSENSVANGVVSLWRAVIATTCYSQITRPLDLKEHVIRYLNVFTGILAVTASFSSHMPTYTEFNRLRGAGVQLALAFFHWCRGAYSAK